MPVTFGKGDSKVMDCTQKNGINSIETDRIGQHRLLARANLKKEKRKR